MHSSNIYRYFLRLFLWGCCKYWYHPDFTLSAGIWAVLGRVKLRKNVIRGAVTSPQPFTSPHCSCNNFGVNSLLMRKTLSQKLLRTKWSNGPKIQGSTDLYMQQCAMPKIHTRTSTTVRAVIIKECIHTYIPNHISMAIWWPCKGRRSTQTARHNHLHLHYN